jgi:hypothetical protein
LLVLCHVLPALQQQHGQLLMLLPMLLMLLLFGGIAARCTGSLCWCCGPAGLTAWGLLHVVVVVGGGVMCTAEQFS